MRWVAASLCVALALVTSACDQTADRMYFRQGIGTQLHASGLADATGLQEEYIKYICQQAGYPLLTAAGGVNSCLDAAGWNAFVQAGMNDIDRRCDAYLAWLDAQRRDRAPVLRQLSTMATAAHAILTVSGAGPKSLEVVSEAFGLATQSYSNWNSRLLLEVDKSTVQTVVYTRQRQFREEIKNRRVVDRPDAIYLLRSYLRICLPITIETDINTSITLVQRGDPSAAKMNPVVRLASRPLTADDRFRDPGRPKLPAVPGYRDIIRNYNPAVHTKALVEPALKKICVIDVEAVGSRTVPLVKVYQHSTASRVTGKLTLAEIARLGGDMGCPEGRLNYYEAHARSLAAGLNTDSVVTLLNAGLPEGKKIVGTPTIENLRKNVLPELRKSLGTRLTLRDPELSGQFTYDLMTELSKMLFQPRR